MAGTIEKNDLSTAGTIDTGSATPAQAGDARTATPAASSNTPQAGDARTATPAASSNAPQAGDARTATPSASSNAAKPAARTFASADFLDRRPELIVSQQAKYYTRLGYAAYFSGIVCEIVVLWLLLRTGASAKLAGLACRVGRWWPLQAILLFAGVCALITAVKAPLIYASGYVVPHAFGMSQQDLWGWLTDQTKLRLLSFAASSAAVVFALWAVRKFARRWGLVVWGASIPFILSIAFLLPIVVEPLLNDFQKMPDNALSRKIVMLAEEAGLDNPPVFIADKSRQTRAYNAYVSGLGASARIVLWDNLLELPDRVVLSVVAHELGHYVLGHVYIGCSLSIAGLLVLCLAAQRLAPWMIARFPESWKIRTPSDIAVIPAAMLLITIAEFVTEPVVNSFSRSIEHQADAFALHVLQDPRALAWTFVLLSQHNLSDADPPALVEFWMYSHPSLRKRMEFALSQDSLP